jgi:putative membrane protein
MEYGLPVERWRRAKHKLAVARRKTKTMKSTRRKLASFGSLAIMVIFGPAPATKAAEGPTDPQIVGIVLAADEIDIDYGRMALGKSQDKAVRDFAQRMVTDHSAVQKNVTGLAQKLGINPEDSPTSDGLKKAAAEITVKLKSLKGKEFDKFYIDNEVNYHKTVTDAVQDVLIPSAQNPELKSALEGAQPLFLKHLEHARMVQSSGSAMAH